MPGFDETEKEIRYRLKDPADFEPESFRFEAIADKDGAREIAMIMGKRKGGDGKMEAQAVRFARQTDDNPNGWTIAEARKWIEEHKEKKELSAHHGSLAFELGQLTAEGNGMILRGAELVPAGHFWDARYAEWDVTEQHLHEMAANFSRTVMGPPGVPHKMRLDVDHVPMIAEGRVENIYVGQSRACRPCLLGDLAVNMTTVEAIRNLQMLYLSPRFVLNDLDYTGDGKKTVGAVLKAVALVNDPFLTGQIPLIELLERAENTDMQPQSLCAPAYFTRADGAFFTLCNAGGNAAFYLSADSPRINHPTPRGAAEEQDMDEKEIKELSVRAARAEQAENEVKELRAAHVGMKAEHDKMRVELTAAQATIKTATETATVERELRRANEAEVFVGQQIRDGKCGEGKKAFWLKRFVEDETGTIEYFKDAPKMISAESFKSHAEDAPDNPQAEVVKQLRADADAAYKADPAKPWALHYRDLARARGDKAVYGIERTN